MVCSAIPSKTDRAQGLYLALTVAVFKSWFLAGLVVGEEISIGLATVVDHTQQILVELEALDLGSDVDIICHQLVGELELVPQLLDLVRDLVNCSLERLA